MPRLISSPIAERRLTAQISMGDFIVSFPSPSCQDLGNPVEEEAARLSDLEVGEECCLLDMVKAWPLQTSSCSGYVYMI